MRLGSACGTVVLAMTVAAVPLSIVCRVGSPLSAPAASVPDAQTYTVLAARRRRDNTDRTTPRWPGALDTGSKAEVTRAFYADYLPPWTVPTGSTGDPDRCSPGTTAAGYRAATIASVNFVRDLAGLAPVTESVAEAASAQAAALIMAANHSLSHNPPSTWRCWTRVGHDSAGRSNLAEGYITAGSAIGGYMSEPGGNAEVGHRRWILNPFARRMGVGAVHNAEALYVINSFDTSRPNPAYIGWPTAHWFPYPLEPDHRWSVSAGDSRTRFGHARVSVLDGSTAVAVHQEAPVDGYGQPTLVWEMPTVHNGHTYTVTVTGIRKVGVKGQFSTSYRTRLFTPVSPVAALQPTPNPSASPAPPSSTPTPSQPSPPGSTTPSCLLLVLCGL